MAADWHDRIIYLKTGFEALLNLPSGGYRGMERLRDLFQDAYLGHVPKDIESLVYVLPHGFVSLFVFVSSFKSTVSTWKKIQG